MPRVNPRFQHCLSWPSSFGAANSRWNVKLIREIFILDNGENIVKLYPPSFGRVDKLLLCDSRSRKFSTNSCYRHITFNLREIDVVPIK